MTIEQEAREPSNLHETQIARRLNALRMVLGNGQMQAAYADRDGGWTPKDLFEAITAALARQARGGGEEARLHKLLTDGWYRPGHSYPILAADADAWITEVQALGLQLLSRPTRPETIEECAAIAVKYAADRERIYGRKSQYVRAALEIAAAIRALSPLSQKVDG